MMRIALVLIGLGLAGCTRGDGAQIHRKEANVLSDKAAIDIATRAIDGKIHLSPYYTGTPVVERREQEIVVTFPRQNPPGLRAGDFDARVTLDRASGTVKKILGSD